MVDAAQLGSGALSIAAVCTALSFAVATNFAPRSWVALNLSVWFAWGTAKQWAISK